MYDECIGDLEDELAGAETFLMSIYRDTIVSVWRDNICHCYNLRNRYGDCCKSCESIDDLLEYITNKVCKAHA